MKGSIHSDQKCPLCGLRFKSQEPKGLFCPQHPSQRPEKYKVIFGKVTRRFNDYPSAYQFLTGLRFQDGSGTMDERDYQIKSKPLSFSSLAEEWLEIKKNNMRPGGWNSIKALMAHAIKEWHNANIKFIQYAQLEDFFNKLQLASKTKSNLMATLKQFWKWSARRYNIPPLKEWPALGRVEMAMRKTIDLETQDAIIQNVKEHESFRVWLCLKWLATYIAVRPSEMLSVVEGDIDRSRGLMIVRADNAKEGKDKLIPLLDSDSAILSSLPLSFDPQTPFFRHDGSRGHTKAGGRFSRQMIYAAWKRACARLGIEGVDMYGGTKHSSAVGNRAFSTYEEVRKMTGHTTNKAFDRYIQLEGAALKELYGRRDKAINS